MIISFCGHSTFREEPEVKEEFLKILEEKISGEDVIFYLGGYGSFDGFARKCCAEYKEKHPNAELIFITPYLGKWLDERKDYIEKSYDGIIYPDIENTPPKFAISKRNEWIINQSDFVIGYVQTHYGGAYNSLLYAHKHNKPYINLYKGDYELY